MSWLSKIMTKQGALRFLDSAGDNLELLSSALKKYPAASIKRTESAPYTRVTQRIASVGLQFFTLNLKKKYQGGSIEKQERAQEKAQNKNSRKN